MSGWETTFMPDNFDEMALYPELKDILQYYYDSKNIPHIILHGDTGTGKSTAANILARRIKPDFSVKNIFDCGGDKGLADVKGYVELLRNSNAGLTRFFINPEPQVFIFDEFHKIPERLQTMLNVTLETTAKDSPCFFCVNDLDKVEPPIRSRCKLLPFDVAQIKNDNLVMFSHHPWNADEWKEELRRVGRIVCKKENVSINENIENEVLSNNQYCVDARKYIQALGEKITMKSFYKKPSAE